MTMPNEERLAKGRGGRPTLKRAEQIDARILAAAADLFIERGVDGTSLEAVAAAAAVSKPTLYARYPDKSRLFVAVIRANVAAAMPVDADRSGTTQEQRLRQVGRTVTLKAMQPVPLGLMRLYIAEAPRHGALIRDLDRMGREVALDAIAGAIADDTGAIEHARIVAGRFLDMVFVPHQMRALLGDLPQGDPLHPTLDARIDDAVTVLKALALLPVD